MNQDEPSERETEPSDEGVGSTTTAERLRRVEGWIGEDPTRRRVMYILTATVLSAAVAALEFGRDAQVDSGGPVPNVATDPDGYGEGPYGSGSFGE